MPDFVCSVRKYVCIFILRPDWQVAPFKFARSKKIFNGEVNILPGLTFI